MTLEKPKKKIIGRYAVLALGILLLSVLQNTDGYFPELFGARAVLLIPVTVSIAMFERDIGGMFFGLFAGALWDVSASGNNFYAIYLVIVGFICGSLINNVLRNNIITASLLSCFWLLLFFAGYWFVHYVLGGLDMAFHMLVRYYLPAYLYSAVLSPLIFLGVRAVETAFVRE